MEPVLLEEDEKTGDRFLVYSTDQGRRLDIRYEGDSLWMTQAQIADLFGVSRQGVNSHLNTFMKTVSWIARQPARKSCRFATRAGER